MGEEELMRLQI